LQPRMGLQKRSREDGKGVTYLAVSRGNEEKKTDANWIIHFKTTVPKSV
jgi:hypothetical protein